MAGTKNKHTDGVSLNNIAFNCFINALISFTVFTLLSFALSLLTKDRAAVKENSKVILVFILVLSSVLNGLLCALRIKIKAVIASSVSAFFMAVLLFILFSIISNFSFTYNGLISMIIVFSSTVLSAIVFRNVIHR